MKFHRRKRDYKALSEINIANLVDVVLVLLIIFMISAPLLQSGIEVNLPQTKAAAVSEQAEGVVVTLDAKGGIYINDIFSNPNQFIEKLKDEMKTKNTTSVYLRADSIVYYGSAINLIGLMKDAGIEEIGLVTEQNAKAGK